MEILGVEWIYLLLFPVLGIAYRQILDFVAVKKQNESFLLQNGQNTRVDRLKTQYLDGKLEIHELEAKLDAFYGIGVNPWAEQPKINRTQDYQIFEVDNYYDPLHFLGVAAVSSTGYTKEPYAKVNDWVGSTNVF